MAEPREAWRASPWHHPVTNLRGYSTWMLGGGMRDWGTYRWTGAVPCGGAVGRASRHHVPSTAVKGAPSIPWRSMHIYVTPWTNTYVGLENGWWPSQLSVVQWMLALQLPVVTEHALRGCSVPCRLYSTKSGLVVESNFGGQSTLLKHVPGPA